MSRPAVFFDRDGTLSREVGYVNHISRIQALPGVAGALKRLNAAGVPVVMVTNQAGAARGYFPESLIEEVNRTLLDELEKEGARIDAVYFCPHLKGSPVPELDVDCDCRKPRTGMVVRAARDLDIDLARSFTVGDKYTDVQLGFAAGCQGILVLTGYGRGELQLFGDTWERKPDFIARDLEQAVDTILKRMDRHD